MSDWIKFDGAPNGEPPMGPYKRVQIKDRTGGVDGAISHQYDWKHYGNPQDIVAYRLLDEPK